MLKTVACALGELNISIRGANEDFKSGGCAQKEPNGVACALE